MLPTHRGECSPEGLASWGGRCKRLRMIDFWLADPRAVLQLAALDPSASWPTDAFQASMSGTGLRLADLDGATLTRQAPRALRAEGEKYCAEIEPGLADVHHGKVKSASRDPIADLGQTRD